MLSWPVFFIYLVCGKQCSFNSKSEIDIFDAQRMLFFFLKIAKLILLPWNAIAKTIEVLEFLCHRVALWLSVTRMHVCFVCVPEIPPPTSLQTQNGSAVVGQKRLVVLAQWLRTVLRAIYAETINAHTKQTNARQHRHEPANNKTSTATATLATYGNNRFSLSVCPLYVLDMWKIERKHIFILLYRWEKWNPIGALFTLLKQKRQKKKKGHKKWFNIFCTIGLCSHLNYGQKDGARCLPSSVEVSTFTLLTRREEAFQIGRSLSGLTQHFSGAQSLSMLI